MIPTNLGCPSHRDYKKTFILAKSTDPKVLPWQF